MGILYAKSKFDELAQQFLDVSAKAAGHLKPDEQQIANESARRIVDRLRKEHHAELDAIFNYDSQQKKNTKKAIKNDLSPKAGRQYG